MIFSIKNTLMSWVMRKRIHQIELFVKYPHDVQKDWLESLISTARFTEFGKKYHFDEIISYTSFRERVPLSNYEDLSPFIERLRKGEKTYYGQPKANGLLNPQAQVVIEANTFQSPRNLSKIVILKGVKICYRCTVTIILKLKSLTARVL